MAASLANLEHIADHLRAVGEIVELTDLDVRLPLELSSRVSSHVEIRWDETVRLRVLLGLAVPDSRRAQMLALISQINPELDGGAFVLGPPLAYETTIPREATGTVNSDLLEDAIFACRNNAVAYFTQFFTLLGPKPEPSSGVQIGSRAIQLTSDEVVRLKGACAAEWHPFVGRLAGTLHAYERLQPWWKNHRVIDVQSPLPVPAVGISVAFGPGGEVHVLRGHLEHLVDMATKDPPPPITDAEQARVYAMFCDAATTDAQWGELPVAAFEDIPFRRMLTGDEKEQIDGLRETHAVKMHPPRVEQVAGGFSFELWTVSMSRLIYRQLFVSSEGRMRRTDVVLADPIPVPLGKAWGLVGDRYVPVA
jgi:hypothetical protein